MRVRTGDPARGSEQDGKREKKKRKKGKEKSQEKEVKKQDGHGDMMGADLYAEDGEGRGLR